MQEIFTNRNLEYKMRIRKVDANQKKIMQLCRRIPGLSVATIHTVGNGLPDLILGFCGKNYLVELKDGAKMKSQKKLTKDEVEFHEEWNGQICVCESIDDILKLINQ